MAIVATSWMNVEAVQASEMLDKYHKISAEVIDVRCLNPLDIDTIIDSVTKTKRCLIADNDWKFCGFSAEIASQIYEKIDENLQQKITRIGFPNVPCPTVRHLENAFYPNANDIFRSIEEMFELAPVLKITEKIYSNENKFKGPF